jgi:hypothetical protein
MAWLSVAAGAVLRVEMKFMVCRGKAACAAAVG